jgi:hypothetical protein
MEIDGGSARQHEVCRTGPGGEYGEVRQIGLAERRVDHASEKEGDIEERVGANSEEPQAGHRYRTERSAQEGGEGPVSEISTQDIASSHSGPNAQEEINHG